MRITDSVHALRIPFKVPIGPGLAIDRFVWSFIILHEGVTLIDSGVSSAGGQILEYVKECGGRPEEVKLLVLTHSHPDHIGAAAAVREAAGCEVAAHGAELAWIQDTALQARERPVPGFDTLVVGPVKVDRVLGDGDTIEIGGGRRLEVLHTPGHSKGSVSLFLRDEGVLVTADAVPVPGDMPIFDDYAASVKSVERLRTLDGVKHLLASWDEPREGVEASRALDNGLAYLEKVRDTAVRCAGEAGGDPLELCRRAVAELGLPPFAANPLVARSFMAAVKDQGL